MVTFSDRQKRAAVKRARAGRLSVAEVAEKAGCSVSTLRSWMAKFPDEGATPPAPRTARAKKPAAAKRPRVSARDVADLKQPVEDPPASAGREVVFDLFEHGARVVSVFGPFASRVMVEMYAAQAAGVFPEPMDASSRSEVFDGVERDLAELAKRDAELARSALAGTARALALEIENPYNSATSKAMCAGQLRDTMARLHDLAPPEQKASGLDDLKGDRAARLGGGSGSTG